MFVGLSAHSFATIANFQWFSKLPSPLNGMVQGNHWDQWFSDGFGVKQPLVTMVFDGCAPLVWRWNGYVPSSKSNSHSENPTHINCFLSQRFSSHFHPVSSYVRKHASLGVYVSLLRKSTCVGAPARTCFQLWQLVHCTFTVDFDESWIMERISFPN